MKAALLAATVLSAVFAAGHDGSAFRYERPLHMTGAGDGQACAVLDATVFSHADSPTLDDLRVIRMDGAGRRAEVPFRLAINDTNTTEDDAAAVSGLRGTQGVIEFDLKMPPRARSSVTLDIAAQNFVGTAEVSGLTGVDGTRTPLGEFAIYDLSSRHLARFTTLPLEETTFPLLHVRLRLHSISGKPLVFNPGIVRGAVVPPSRQAQRLFTTVATTSIFQRDGQDTVATLQLLAHIPAERVQFVLAPGYDGNFERAVDIVVTPDGAGASDAEAVKGTISSVELAPSAAEPIPVRSQNTIVDTGFAANFQSSATLQVRVHDGGQPSLPLRAVNVAMRQRTICFAVERGFNYGITYGSLGAGVDAGPSAPAPPLGEHTMVAVLGPEVRQAVDPQSQAEAGILQRQPDLLWVGLLAFVAVLGSVALRRRRVRRS
ncbi:MAG: hypothetical protein ABI142_10075 [Bryocella sp.]